MTSTLSSSVGLNAEAQEFIPQVNLLGKLTA